MNALAAPVMGLKRTLHGDIKLRLGCDLIAGSAGKMAEYRV